MLTVLGGGVAGLAVGYYASRSGRPFTILEAGSTVGGNCRTLSLGPFRFDTGAHRIHAHDAAVTRDLRELLGSELRLVTAPSHVWRRGRLVSFPLRPLDLARKLGAATTLRAALDLVVAKLGLAARAGDDFESFAVRAYGRTIAREFLLDYSSKLWGLPCSRLSPRVAGRRLNGLDLRTFVVESLRGTAAATTHLDGSFLYPRGGFGRIAERLADSAGRQHVRCGARVTRLLHDGAQVHAVELAGGLRLPCEAVASTLPLPQLVRLFEPALPGGLFDLASRLRFRDVALVALALDRPAVTESATVYFPDPLIPFTRLYEPRNRCPEMAPAGRTMLVAELPADSAVRRPAAELVTLVRDTLVRIGWIAAPEVVDAAVHFMPNAYPVLEQGADAASATIAQELGRFRNLWLSGRNGCFAYTHVHDLMRQGREVAAAWAARRQAAPAAGPARGAGVSEGAST